MKPGNDQKLLQAWSRDRCEESFRTLVDRYAGLVFGTALRRTADRQLAEEVSQNVFTALAKKAGQLDGRDGIGGWLFKTTILEAAACRRSEARRNRRMRELTELEAALRKAGVEAADGEVMAVVDEGLAGLGSRDRSVLVARFYHGASFEDLARSTGRSEAACRKQVSRALRKLTGFLEGRGVRVSSTVLATGLGTLLSTEAPAGLAATCASTAMAVSAGVAAPGILTTLTTAMSTSKVTGIIAIGSVLLLATTGTAYLAGRENAKKIAADEEGASRAEVAASPAKRGGPDNAGGPRKEMRSEPSAKADGETRVEVIVNTLKKELRGKGWDTAMEVGPPLVQVLRASEMEEALALSQPEQNESLRQMIEAILYGRWGSLDGQAAAEHVLTQDSEDTRRVGLERALPAWAAEDPHGALAWHKQELGRLDDGPVDEATANRLLGSLLRGWATTDMAGAWTAFEAMDSDQQVPAVRQLRELIEQPQYREPMAGRIAEISDEDLRARVVEEVGEKWVLVDPQAAATWFETVGFTDSMLRLRTALEIGERWFETNPGAAATWLWPMVPEQMHDRFVQGLSQGLWAEDRQALSAWLEARGYSIEELEQKSTR